MYGTRALTSLRCAKSNGCPASMAIASVWSTVLVEPPIATSSANAFSKAWCVRMSLGRIFFATRSTIRRPASANSSSRFGSVARMLPLPGSAQPSASFRQFMLLAVNIPLHEPQVGHAFSSMSCNWLRLIVPADTLPTPSKTVARSIASPVLALPAFIGPPLTKIDGMLTRAAPIIMPGTILSQLGMQTTPSKQWARSIVSTQSAISSREASEYFMPT